MLIAFAESVLKRKAELPRTCYTVEEFKAAQAKCRLEIAKLRTDLLALVSNQIITAGYILDSQLFADLTEWFERPDNLKRFGGWWNTLSDLFWVNDYGSLQSVAAPRDAHVCRTGIGSVVDDGLLPDRTLKNADGTSHFVSSSRLGLDFFLGYYSQAGGGLLREGVAGSRASWAQARLQILCRAKTEALQNLCTAQTSQLTGRGAHA